VHPPQTQYVERDEISIAYQVAGDGPVDVLISPGFCAYAAHRTGAGLAD
jgi:hypothetical protein